MNSELRKFRHPALRLEHPMLFPGCLGLFILAFILSLVPFGAKSPLYERADRIDRLRNIISAQSSDLPERLTAEQVPVSDPYPMFVEDQGALYLKTQETQASMLVMFVNPVHWNEENFDKLLAEEPNLRRYLKNDSSSP